MRMVLGELLEVITQNPTSVFSVNDYDGTNANILPVLSEARPDLGAKHALLAMQDLDPSSVLFITGRAVEVVDGLCDLEEERRGDHFQNIAGQHGGELRLGGESVPTAVLTTEELAFLNEKKAEVKEFVLQALKSQEGYSSSFPVSDEKVIECVVEEKPLSFALHTRALREAVSTAFHNKEGADSILLTEAILADATVLALDEVFEAYVRKLSSEAPRFLEGAESFPVFLPEIAEMTYEFKPHKLKANKGKVLEELLTNDAFKDKALILWAGDDLKGTDGDVADFLRSERFVQSGKQAFVIQVLRKGDERKEYNAENYGAEFKASRKPDLVFESPAEYGEFLAQVVALQQAAKTFQERDAASAAVLTQSNAALLLPAGHEGQLGDCVYPHTPI